MNYINHSRALDASYAKRNIAPDDVWDIYHPETWHETIRRISSDFLSEEVMAAFLACPPEYVVGDDLSWLDKIVMQVQRFEIDSKEELAFRLQDHYRAIRACHGTSVPFVNKIYEEGLRPLEIEHFHDQARQIFLSGKFPELSESNLQLAIATVGADFREGRVFFEANERELVDRSNHYMAFGSEYLTALAANLNGSQDYRRILKGRYPPTVFICDVPLQYLTRGVILEFAGTALESIFQKLLDGLSCNALAHRGMGFSIKSRLEGCHIVGHYHPTIGRNPFSL